MSGPFGSQQWMYASGGFYDHPIDQSLRFNIGDYPYLDRTPSSAGNRKTWTWSAWVKRGQLTLVQYMFAARQLSVNTPYSLLYFGSSDQLTYIDDAGTTLVSTPVYRDTSSWYHIVLSVDTTQATASNRYKFYVNGTQVTDFSTATYAAQNSDTAVNAAIEHDIGVAPNGVGNRVNHFDGYLAEINLVDGTALDASSFGENKSGVWIPKKYTGSYGTNGFYLPFKNATIANETDAATITAPFGGTAANGKDPDGNFVTSNTTTGSGFTLLHYDLGSSKNIQEYVIKRMSFTGGTSTFQVQYSNNNSTWIPATSLSVTSTPQDFNAGWSVTARYWRIQATAFGTNGAASIDSFQLFSGEIGIDDSGNNNDFSSRKVLPSDIVLDSPTNNFATLSPLATTGSGAITFSEGNLKGNGYAKFAFSTINPTSGKYYMEAVLLDPYVGGGGVNHYGSFFLAPENTSVVFDASGVGTGARMINYSVYGGFYSNGTRTSAYTSWATNDVIGFAIDYDAQTMAIYQNGVLKSTETIGANDTTIGIALDGTSGDTTIDAYNFGQDSSFAGQKTAQGYTDANGIGDFYYQPPSGYLALCTANLPDPVAAIDPAQDANPQDYFNTVLYTGNAPSTQSITGVGFEPEMVWTKSRSSAGNHGLHDILRLTGSAPRILYPDLINAESPASSGGLVSFDSDGFSLTNNNISNTSGVTYVAWNWKAGGTGVSNTDGTITSTVSANTDAGLSIVGWAGNNSSSATVGHGLGSSAEMIILKDRTDGTNNWRVWHKNLSTNYWMYLNLSNAQVNAAIDGGLRNVNASTFGFINGTTDGVEGVNSSSSDYIAYCFHSVDGFSKFGSYTGNGSTDGPFVYCGFRPAFVLYKRVDVATSWVLLDTKRNPINVSGNQIFPDLSNAEFSGLVMDILSNGFKVRDGSSSNNASGGTYIFMAFAEMPFKYANAR